MLAVGEAWTLQRSQSEQCLLDRLAIEQFVVPLVCVAHQAIVTGGFAVLRRPVGSPEILAGLGVEMADPQCFAGDVGECVRLVEQATENSRSALGGFVEQDLRRSSVDGSGSAPISLSSSW